MVLIMMLYMLASICCDRKKTCGLQKHYFFGRKLKVVQPAL